MVLFKPRSAFVNISWNKKNASARKNSDDKTWPLDITLIRC